MKKTTVVGKSLYLVEGTVRWGLFDLERETVTVLDKKSGKLVNNLRKIQIPSNQKLIFLENYAPSVWSQIQRLEISERLFEPDSSVSCNRISLELCWLELTNACNQKCVHCYAEASPKRNSFISVEVAREAIQQARREGFRALQLTGGEPFLHPNLWQIAEHACVINFPEVEIYTNLTLITKNDLIRIRKLGIRLATTLLGANATIHDNCTGTYGSFECWYRNIKQVQSLGIPYRIAVTRVKQNEKFIDDIRRFLYNEKIVESDKLLRIDDCRPTGRGSNTAILPSEPQERKLFLTVNSKFFQCVREYNTCWAGKIAISPDGNVYPCIFAKKIDVGDISKEPFLRVLERLKRKCWTITLDQVTKCKDCELRYACKDCRALSLSVGRGLYGAPVRCDYDPYH